MGKTQFLLSLTGKDNHSFPPRTRQLRHYDIVTGFGRRVCFIDTPGHQSNGKIRGEALAELSKGRIEGVINLVDYGYQDSEQIKNNPDVAFKTGTSEVKQEYLRENRKLEKERTKEIIDRIERGVKLKWFITLINKADVWNDNRQEVIDYYEGPDFNSVMENLEHAVSTTVCPFCSIITPFGNKPMLLSYNECDKRADYNNLIVTIEEFIEGRHEQ